MMKNQWPTIMGRQIAPNPNPESKLLNTINGDYNSVQFNNYGTLANQKNNSLYNRSKGSLANFGMFNNSGRVFNENLAKINNQSITKNTGEAYNDVTINNSGEFINGNRFTVGEGLVANNGDFNIFGLLINYGKISNTGNIYLSPGFSSNALQASCRFSITPSQIQRMALLIIPKIPMAHLALSICEPAQLLVNLTSKAHGLITARSAQAIQQEACFLKGIIINEVEAIQ